jgi:hypothetical protein
MQSLHRKMIVFCMQQPTEIGRKDISEESSKPQTSFLMITPIENIGNRIIVPGIGWRLAIDVMNSGIKRKKDN